MRLRRLAVILMAADLLICVGFFAIVCLGEGDIIVPERLKKCGLVGYVAAAMCQSTQRVVEEACTSGEEAMATYRDIARAHQLHYEHQARMSTADNGQEQEHEQTEQAGGFMAGARWLSERMMDVNFALLNVSCSFNRAVLNRTCEYHQNAMERLCGLWGRTDTFLSELATRVNVLPTEDVLDETPNMVAESPDSQNSAQQDERQQQQPQSAQQQAPYRQTEQSQHKREAEETMHEQGTTQGPTQYGVGSRLQGGSSSKEWKTMRSEKTGTRSRPRARTGTGRRRRW